MFNRYKRILKVMERIEEKQKLILEKLDSDASGLDGDTASALLQEGIDNIMGYQWPPAKGGKE